MDKPFTADLRELADGMGIGLYQRFTPTEASLFLRCPLKEITKLQASMLSVNDKLMPSGDMIGDTNTITASKRILNIIININF
ncbi:hypothetical protein GCM10011369_30970 [Neiella marina]|uniref:Uncharacterized protein n=1 Tax=Neiella marina TaxID=508461 RepID=A0A8J2U920_9GAMM|nr:hypothetical protein [Neiella marina]GGA86704.1 hypothetical protein GCM10011369_30970 [Neiella marina]